MTQASSSVRTFALQFFSSLVRARHMGNPRLHFGAGVVIKGWPLISTTAGGSISVGDRVTLNSLNRYAHVNMFGPVKLIADRQGAVIEIGSDCRINGGCIHAYERITIGDRCLIAPNCQIFDGSGHDACFEDPRRRIHTRGSSKPVNIESDVWLGAGVIVLPGTRIGAGSIVGAGSVVSHDLPPMCMAAGNPAVVRRQF